MMRFLATVIVVALAYALAFGLWVSLLPATPDVTPQADGIVVLTGGGPRLDMAVALFEKGAGQPAFDFRRRHGHPPATS